MRDEIKDWPGLPHETIQEIGNRYEVGCLIAAGRAKELHPGDPAAMAKSLVEMRRGIRMAIVEELATLGCPVGERGRCLQQIIDHQVKFRMQEARRQEADAAGSSALH